MVKYSVLLDLSIYANHGTQYMYPARSLVYKYHGAHVPWHTCAMSANGSLS